MKLEDNCYLKFYQKKYQFHLVIPLVDHIVIDIEHLNVSKPDIFECNLKILF